MSNVSQAVQQVCSGLGDPATFSDSLAAGTQLAASGMTPAEARAVVEASVKVPIQTRDQPTRLAVFTMLEGCMSHVEALPATAEFLGAFIAAIDGERDPRCLLKTFCIHAKASMLLQAEGMATASPQLHEDMFDVISCYFPIAYSPPKSEANPVKKSELKDAILSTCTLPAFAKFAIPFALDKLSSPIGETKADSLTFIRRCCEAYGENAHHLVEPYFTDLWPQIRTEALQGTLRGDNPVLREIFETVKTLCRLVASFGDEDITHAHLKPLLDGVLNMASVREGFINKKAYSALIHFACVSDERVLTVILSRLVPMLHGAFLERPDDVDRRVAIMSVYSAILGGVAKLGLSLPGLGPASQSSVASIREALEATASSDMSDDEGFVICAEACSSIITASPPEGDARAASGLVKICLDLTDAEARGLALKALESATACPRGCTGSTIIPQLLSASPADSERSLECLTSLARDEVAFRACLAQAVRQAGSETGGAQPGFLTRAILALGEARWDASPLLHTPDTPSVSEAEFTAAVECFRASGEAASSPGLHAVALSFAVLLPPDAQLRVLGAVHAAEGLSPLCCALACAVSPESSVPFLDSLSAEAAGELLRDPANSWFATAFASRANKVGHALPSDWASSPHWGLLARGGVTRGGAVSTTCLSQAVDRVATLTQSDVPQIRLLFDSGVRGLSRVLGHRSAPLWRQKAYSFVLKALLSAYGAADAESQRGVVFQCIGAVVSGSPAGIVSADADTLLPVVARGVMEAQPSEGAAALSILQSLVDSTPSSFAKVPLLRTLIPAVLKLTQCAESKSVREASLKVLRAFATKKEISSAAVQFKDTVVEGLRPRIDDHKRAVRQAAAQARASWYLLA
eukprot:TRINITY_DN838_c0_g2_i1.p1 TRINITY_DN838_c0_g2~~TRINITY_DN838_c0_g2_i1.p1  ORF type:complete len:869 (+),score=260.04 TRINITY_DN838_c0_g2_i1:93-2699(+)